MWGYVLIGLVLGLGEPVCVVLVLGRSREVLRWGGGGCCCFVVVVAVVVFVVCVVLFLVGWSGIISYLKINVSRFTDCYMTDRMVK